MSEKKQTAVMWLISKFPSYVVKEYQDEFDKALQMEREQIEEAYASGKTDASLFDTLPKSKYYTDTYGE